MTRSQTFALYVGCTAVLLVLDLWSKAAVFEMLHAEIILREGQHPLLQSGPEKVLFPGFALQAALNTGAFNGMLSGMRWLLLSVSIIAAIGTLVVALTPKKMPWHLTTALGLIAGGAIGNFYDRFHYGAVRDFVKWYAGDYVWPNFNIADSGIVVGVGIILFNEIQTVRREKRAQRAAAAATSGDSPATPEGDSTP